MVLQTNAKLHERALQDNISYDMLMTYKEQSVRRAAALERASGQPSDGDSSKFKIEDEVHRLRKENKQLKGKGKKPCGRCGQSQCTGERKYTANGHKCGKY